MKKFKFAIILFILTVISFNSSLCSKTYTYSINSNSQSHYYDMDTEKNSVNRENIDNIKSPTNEEKKTVTQSKNEILDENIKNIQEENITIQKEENKETTNKTTASNIETPILQKSKINPYNYTEKISYDSFSDDDIRLINDVLDAYEVAKNLGQSRYEVKLDYIPSYQCYKNTVSFFHIYYGIQKETFDVVYDLRIHGNEYASIDLYVDNMNKFNDIRNKNTNEIQRIIGTFNEGTEKEIIAQVVQFIADKTTYTYENYDVEDIIFEGKGVCNAYALTMTRFCQLLSIKADICIGNTPDGKHAWNRITYSDGTVEYFDVSFYDTAKTNKNQYINMKETHFPVQRYNLYY